MEPTGKTGQNATPEDRAQDAALIEKLAAGDTEAERTFCLRFHPKLRLMLSSRTRDPELGADLTQEVLIEALCALRQGRLREPEKLNAFVIGIGRNLLNNHFRGQQKTPDSVELPEEIRAPDGEDPVEVRQRQLLAARAIAELEEVDREIVRLTLVEGLKPGVIAQMLSLSSTVVRQRKTRATRRIAEFIQKMSQSGFGRHSDTGRFL